MASQECDAGADLRAFKDNVLPVRIDHGVLIVERGTPGDVGYSEVQGRPTADGRLTMLGTAISSGKRNYGREINVRFDGAFVDGAFALTGHTGSRACRMTIRLETRP